MFSSVVAMAPHLRYRLLLSLSILLVASLGTSAEDYVECPLTPLRLCDFYFEGYRNQLPVFKVQGGGAPISPVVLDQHSDRAIEVDQSGTTSFLCANNKVRVFNDTRQFYLTGGKAMLHDRPYNGFLRRKFYNNRCLLLHIREAQIPVGNDVINLNPLDQYGTDYPKHRRCVVPTFALRESDYGDYTLGSPLKSFKLNATAPVEVDSTGPGQFDYCPVRSPATSAEGQFYVAGEEGMLHVRVFQTTPGIANFQNRCVLLHFTAMAFSWNGTYLNLNIGDGNEEFPQPRRCVVFRTK
eukprot:jgi/Mesen1/10531/ME000083S10042